MLNWLSLIFIFLGALLRPFFNLNLWPQNLLIIITSRSLYIIGFYLNYVKYPETLPEGKRYIPYSNKNYASFISKNLTMIILSLFSSYIAIILGVYSTFTFSTQLRNVCIRKVSEKYRPTFKFISVITKLTIPFIFFFAMWNFTFYELSPTVERYIPEGLVNNVAKIFPIAIGVLIYGFPGRFYANLPKIKMYKYYNHIILGEFANLPRIRKALIVLIILVPSTIGIGIGVSYPSKLSTEIITRDGYSLKTDVYFSKSVGSGNPAPVVLVRSPYGMREMIPELDTMRYCSQAFHVVLQDCRNTADSSGSKSSLLFVNATTDAEDTIEWIMEQDWCDGNIASSGISAMAINAYFYAGMGMDGLKTQSLWFGTPDLIADAMVPGAYRESLVDFWLQSTGKNWEYQLDYIYDVISDIDLFNTEYPPKAVSLSEGENIYEKVNVSALHVGGWYDIFLGGTLRGYRGYNELGTSYAKGHQKLIIGPWTHGMVQGGRMGDIAYPSNSLGAFMITNWESEMLDYGLRGINKSGMWDDKVAYYLMGDPKDRQANYWKYAEDWPLPGSVESKWYLGSDGNGNNFIQSGDSGLSERNISYLYDPRYPLKTKGGALLFRNPVGPVDQRSVEEVDGVLRDDLLLFESEVLTEGINFEGLLRADLVISSNCNDTDFMVKLCDIYPDGRRILINDGALTTRYRDVDFYALNGPNHVPTENFLEPGKEYNITVDLIATAYRFAEGHKIGIVISSSNYNRYHLNPNTGGPITDHWTEGFIANNTIITGPGKSCIVFSQL